MDYYYDVRRGLVSSIHPPGFFSGLQRREENIVFRRVSVGDVLVQIRYDQRNWKVYLWVRGSLGWTLLEQRYLHIVLLQ